MSVSEAVPSIFHRWVVFIIGNSVSHNVCKYSTLLHHAHVCIFRTFFLLLSSHTDLPAVVSSCSFCPQFSHLLLRKHVPRVSFREVKKLQVFFLMSCLSYFNVTLRIYCLWVLYGTDTCFKELQTCLGPLVAAVWSRQSPVCKMGF